MDIELMEKKLYDACVEGDVETLEALMREDKLILARLSLFSCFNQTPLHLACMLGHFEFAKSVLSYKPDFASRIDSQGCSPLHLASANGYADIVGLLLRHDQKMCRVGDEDGRTPLHLAVMNGQHECVRELIQINYDYGQQGAILHLCVMYNRLNILILILESTVQDLSNTKDDKGNTILHSAVAMKRMQIIKYLVMNTREVVVDVNAVNENGLTALDMIEQMPEDVKTMEIKELLVSAGSLRAMSEKGRVHDMDRPITAVPDNNSKRVKTTKKSTRFSIFRKKAEKRDKTLLVAASVIAAMAYQAAISPPGGVAGLDATENLAPFSSPSDYHLKPTTSLLAHFESDYSNAFWISNTISFMASLSVIFVYVTGASLRRSFFIWLIRLGMWITLTSMTLAYLFAVEAITPDRGPLSTTIHALSVGLLSWILLILLSILVLVYRFLSYIVRTIIKIIRRATKKKNTSEEAEAAASFISPNTNIV